MTDEGAPARGSNADLIPIIAQIAARFALPEPIEAQEFEGKGNINLHTYLVTAGDASNRGEYILQCINETVFTQPRNVMSAMLASIEAQRNSMAQDPAIAGGEWDVITLIPTREGDPYLDLTDGPLPGVWRLMVRIPNTRSYKSLSEIADADERLRIAEEVGRGLAVYSDLTTTVDTHNLSNPLPGYRDTRNYYNQLLAVLRGSTNLAEAAGWLPLDEVVRESTSAHFVVHLSHQAYRRRLTDKQLKPYIELAREQEHFGLTLMDALTETRIRTVAIHGDTKIENFLFDANTGNVKALIDLDTIMPHTWLVDWGDMVRSLVNVAGEKEPDMRNVKVDMDVYRAVAKGFVGTAKAITANERALMVAAVEVMALELGVRFLADYLRGDSYFVLGPDDPEDLNKTRAMVQLTLFQRLRERVNEAREAVAL